MKKLLLGCAFAALSGISAAATVVSQIGDADGFGLGITHGQALNYADVGGGDGDGTDVWMYGSQSFTHTYSLAGLGGPITSATLEIFTGGQGLDGLTSVLIDGVFVGTLTDGDDVGPAYNYAWMDVFDLNPFLALLNGANTISFNTTVGGDGWVLDYSRLTVNADVPEPAGIALLSLGLAGLAFSRKKKQA